jgi:hypothetical protein
MQESSQLYERKHLQKFYWQYAHISMDHSVDDAHRHPTDKDLSPYKSHKHDCPVYSATLVLSRCQVCYPAKYNFILWQITAMKPFGSTHVSCDVCADLREYWFIPFSINSLINHLSLIDEQKLFKRSDKHHLEQTEHQQIYYRKHLLTGWSEVSSTVK